MSGTQKTGGINQWLLAAGTVVVCSGISWALLLSMAAPKAISASDISGIKTTIGHMMDLITGLNNFTGFQNTRIDDLGGQTQLKFTDTDTQITKLYNTAAKTISDLDLVRTQSETKAVALDSRIDLVSLFANATKTSLDSLTANTTASLNTVNTRINDTTASFNTRISDTTASLNASLNTVNTRVTDTTASLNTALNTVNTRVTDTAASLNASLDTLSTRVTATAASLNASVDSLKASLTPGLSILPSLTTTSTGGIISLSIKSDTAQAMAFSILFRPTVPVTLNDTTFEAALKALYVTPPVTLSSGSTVRGDYSIYWNPSDSKYYLGSIIFYTESTSLAVGTQSKDITYTANSSYQILITPIYSAG